jgi:hypothetical protein
VVIATQLPKWTYATSVAKTAAFRSSLPINAEPAYRRRTGISDAKMRSASARQGDRPVSQACTHKWAVLRPRELRQVKRRHRPAIIAVGLVRTALIYGDGATTPSISVLSALESFNMATPASNPSFCLAQAASLVRKRLSFTGAIRRMVVMTLIASTESRPDAKRVRSTALRGEKAPTIDQCCNSESLAERSVGLCGQLRV